MVRRSRKQKRETVSLKKYLEQAIEHTREISVVSDKLTRRALKLDRKEVRRRLKGLNHEAARIQEVLEKSVPRELHQQEMDQAKKS